MTPADRRLEGFLIALIWVVGVELFPLMHMGLHAVLPEHEHGVHHHGDVAHADHDDPEERSSDHGEGSLAHRDLAAASTSADLIAYGRLDLLEHDVWLCPVVPVLAAFEYDAPARGPPTDRRFDT